MAFIVFDLRQMVISARAMDAGLYRNPQKTLVDLPYNASLIDIAWLRGASISKSSR